MSVLDKKLLRDLTNLKGQVITIALVVACGITSYVTMRTAYDSLISARDRYYEDNRFADVFVSLGQAPRSVEAELQQIDGVSRVQTRIVESALVPIPGRTRPASGTVVSLDPGAEGARLNDVHLKQGRLLDHRHPDEVLVIESFAEVHGLQPGSELQAVLGGTLRRLRVVGVVLSPEYIMTLAPGDLSYDPGSFPVLWMSETALAASFRMAGAFNSAAFTLGPEANPSHVLARVNEVLEPYGGRGAIPRDKQTSHFMLSGELTQLANMAGFVPYLFLFVAALLVNVVLSRLVQLQRGVIATLKAIGYPNRRIGLHYFELVSLIMVGGAVLGVVAGAWLGSGLMELYTGQFFRFPNPRYELAPGAVFFSVGVSLAAAFVGAWLSVRHVMKMPPAEAMQPPAPPRYRRSILERVGLWAWLGPESRMIWREVSRAPLRLVLSAIGISLALGIVVVARSMWDSMDYLIDVQFHRSMREDLTVTFSEPVAPGALSSLRRIPGVYTVEGLRSVPVRFRADQRYRDTAITGYPAQHGLRRLLDSEAREHEVPAEGLLLTTKLAEILEVAVGDTVLVELKQGDWSKQRVPVVGVVGEPFGLAGHMNAGALARLMGDTGPVNTALLVVDSLVEDDIERRLASFPKVASVSSPRDFKRQFDEQSVAMIGVFTAIMTFFSCVIAVGVVYNNARVALSQRNRDLASLRVLGFTRREIATILFGEQLIQVVLAVPLGLLLGDWMARAMMSNVDPETYRLPVVISPSTYLFAIAVAAVSAIFSGLLLRRKLSRLDLIGVLKTRE